MIHIFGNKENKWTDSLKEDIYERLCGCYSTKDDILPLAQSRWSWIKQRERCELYSKEDALCFVLELLEANSCDFELTQDEYNEVLNNIR